MFSEVEHTRKEVDDVMGGAAAWDNAPQTDGACAVDAIHCVRAPPLVGPCLASPLPCLMRAPLNLAARCPKCDHTRAYYFQLQIRSADEPMTTFLKCVSCGNQWNDQS